MALRLKHKLNSLNKRICGEYAHGLLVASQDLIRNKDEISKLNMIIAISNYFHLKLHHYTILYEYVKRHFNETDEVFDFGIFRIPEPEEKDFGTFIVEFMDLILPHIFPHNRYTEYLQEEGYYEQFGIKVEAGDRVVDAGANMGIFSAYAASKGAEAYAFEPFPRSLKYLYKTAGLNRTLSGKITVVPLALMDEKGTLQFTIDDRHLGTASAIIKRDDKFVELEGISLDEWVEEHSIPRIDFIKADIEGAERNLLRGATRILRECKPKLAICTYHLKDDPDVLENIIVTANPGYKVYHSRHKLFAQ
jgi:FkbM family methyltransferase